jgi:hypothetical protein
MQIRDVNIAQKSLYWLQLIHILLLLMLAPILNNFQGKEKKTVEQLAMFFICCEIWK